MVVYEQQEDGTTRAYSDIGMMIQGGFPHGLYMEAYDPTNLHRTYVETNIPIPDESGEEKEEGQED